MGARFEELAWASTPMGEISLRRRVEPTLGIDVFEVKLGDEFLMSSLFTASEVALARLGLAALAGSDGPSASPAPDGRPAPGGWDVVVGGLGLGFTARTVLQDDRVASLTVVDALAEVIGWHVDGVLPDSRALVEDPRTRLLHGDFFAMARAEPGLDPAAPGRTFDAVLVDIDHTPEHLLHASHGDLYSVAGLRRVSRSIRPGGVFGLWSDDPPEPRFEAVMGQVFAPCSSHVVEFPNHLTGGRSACTVYLGTVPRPGTAPEEPTRP